MGCDFKMIKIKLNIVKELSNYKFAYLPFFNFEGIIGNYKYANL